MPETRADGLGPICGATLLIVLVLLAATTGGGRLAAALQLGPVWKMAAVGVLPAVLAVAAAVGAEAALTGRPPGECLGLLGLGAPSWDQLKVGALCLAPIAVAYLVMFAGLGVPSDLERFLPLLILKFTVSQGIAEEVVFRGFAFRHLRAKRSFWRAATLSAALFGGAHLSHLLHGFSAEVLANMGISIAFGFLMAYPMACLFERGGNVIWGACLLHVGIDSINWLAKAPESWSGPGIVYLMGLAASLAMVFLLSPILLPEPA